MKRLSEKQRIFCESVGFKGENPPRAYIHAGYKDTKNARQGAWVLLQKPYIQAEVKRQQKLRDETLKNNGAITLAKCQEKFEKYEKLAAEKGDIANAIRCVEDITKTIAGFKENQTNPQLEREIAENKEDEQLVNDFIDFVESKQKEPEANRTLTPGPEDGVEENSDAI